MSFVMSGNDILKEYKEAADKRAQVKILADLNACKPREIAEFLSQCGQEVDKRYFWEPPPPRKRKPAAQPITPEPDPEEPAPAPEPEPKAEEPEEPCMTAGVLAALLAKVDPEAPVWLDGVGPASGFLVSVCYGADGGLEETAVVVVPKLKEPRP